MKNKATPILNAGNEPAMLTTMEDFIGNIRSAFAPVFHADPDNIPRNQSIAVSAAAMFAGMTVGHMLVLEVLDESNGDRDQAKLVAMQAFDAGVDYGLRELRDAMLKEMGAGHD